MSFADAMIASLVHLDAFRDPLTFAVMVLAAIQALENARLVRNQVKVHRGLFVAEWLLVLVCAAYWLLPPTPAHAWFLPTAVATWAAAARHLLPRLISVPATEGAQR